eukprot:433188_1
MSAFLILLGLLISIVTSEDKNTCRGLYENGVPVQPLGVCLEKTDLGGSAKFECDDNNDAVMKVYATSDCSLVGKDFDVPITFENVTCDSELKRCPYAKFRQYTSTECEESDVYLDLTVAVGFCNSGIMYQCTDTEVIQQTYSSTQCDGAVTSTIKTCQQGGCELGVLCSVTECNTDKAIKLYTTVGTNSNSNSNYIPQLEPIFLAFITTISVL